MPLLTSRTTYQDEERGIKIVRFMKDLKCIFLLVGFKDGQTIILSEPQWELLFTTIKDELREPI